MTGHHHRSGPLKQKNKKHKTGKHDSKTLLTKKSGGKVERTVIRSSNANSSNALQANSKTMRVQRQKQLRQNKKDDLVLQRRFGLGSSLGPPKIVALIALSDATKLEEVTASIFESATSIEQPKANALGNARVGVFAQHKQKISVIECGNDLLVAMDAAKVADIVVYVMPVYHGAEHSVNEVGDRIISAIRAQGVPSVIGLIQGLEVHATKAQNDLKKYGHRFFQTEFGDAAKVACANVNAQLSRMLVTMSAKTIHWRDERSYLTAMAAAVTPNEDQETGTLRVSGYIRGKPLSVNQLIHVTDVGTFQMSHISYGQLSQVTDGSATMEDATDDNDHVIAYADPSLQEDLQFEATYDPFAAEQTWPTAEELEDAEREAKSAPNDKGMSSYQAAWIDAAAEDGDHDGDAAMNDGSDNEQDEEVDQSFCQVGPSSDAGDEDEDDDDISMDEDDDDVQQRRFEEFQAKRKLESENQSFPDEVDVPRDSSARVRFARYRGMKSLRTSAWDPKESLPSDYARLFQFEDFPMVQRMALERGRAAERAMKADLRRKTSASRSRASSFASVMELDDAASTTSTAATLSGEFGSAGYVASGVYVTLHLKNVPLAALQARITSGPLIMGALLKHENRLSVLNFTIQRAATFTDPLKSKEPLMFHCGFRRYAGKPVFSDQSLKSDQHLFQRFLPQSGWAVATVYAPVTFQPASVLLFRAQSLDLVASGTLMNVNPDRIVLKRVVITGTPVKVKKRNAVVRYMFHSPEDIRWFKPVELSTKHGMTGHIKESLGTHGDFKAVFNKPVKQHDTVCLNLYKRVYPKFVV